jgi:hypothetical protein
MSITLDEILMLAGRLDDAAGFDAPRERFRRFLSDHVTTAQSGRAFIEQSQRLVDEQHHRALQDLVVLLGRPLGFETSFGSYRSVSGLSTNEGFWRSRGRLDVVLELRTNLTTGTDVDSLARSVAAHIATSRPGSDARVVGLSVLTSLYPGRERLEQSLEAGKRGIAIRIMSLRSLLVLADLADAGRLTHADILRLLDAVPPIDFVAGLLATVAHPTASAPLSAEAPVPTRETSSRPTCWLAAVTGDNVITAERFLEVVVGKRRIFGVRAIDSSDGAARPGDRICFFVAGRGAVGHAEVSAIGPSGTGLRDGHQYSQLLQLEHTRLHLDTPVSPELETTLRLRAAASHTGPGGHAFLRISEREYLALTGANDPATDRGDRRPASDAAAGALGGSTRTLSDAGSRSRE